MDCSEDMLKWLDALKDSDKYIVVEGSKDKSALAALGISKERIMTLKKPAYEIAEILSENTEDVVILTDLDAEGKKLYMSLKTNLSMQGIRVDRKFREFLFRRTKLSHIEGIHTFFKNNVF